MSTSCPVNSVDDYDGQKLLLLLQCKREQRALLREAVTATTLPVRVICAEPFAISMVKDFIAHTPDLRPPGAPNVETLLTDDDHDAAEIIRCEAEELLEAFAAIGTPAAVQKLFTLRSQKSTGPTTR
jgi:hypothetical protein